MLFRPLKADRPPYSKRKQSAARRVKPKNIPLADITIGNRKNDSSVFTDFAKYSRKKLPAAKWSGERFYFKWKWRKLRVRRQTWVTNDTNRSISILNPHKLSVPEIGLLHVRHPEMSKNVEFQTKKLLVKAKENNLSIPGLLIPFLLQKNSEKKRFSC